MMMPNPGKARPLVNTEDATFTEFLDDYFVESEEHLVSIRRHLLVLEAFVNRDRMDPGVLEAMDELLGALHSIKGLSAMVGIRDVQRLAHAMEDSIQNVKKSGAAPSEDAMKALIVGTEVIEQIIAARRRQKSAPDINAVLSRLTRDELPRIPAKELVATMETVTPSASQMAGVRIDMKRLDHLMAMVGDLVVSRGHVDETLRRLEDILPAFAWRELQEANFLLQRQLRSLREGVMRIRMVPIGNIFERMRFLIRGQAHESQKDIRLEVTGENTEIDKLFVEKMMDPLLHMVRNAISHGLEPSEERIASGKTGEGHLWIRARTEAESIVLELEDDGRGVDIEQVANRSRALGLIDPDDHFDAARVLQMICTPGFSTREQADLGAGHGVGMTIVKTTINSLGGTLAMETRAGKGTRFTIRLPLTLVIMESLIVYVNDQAFAVPRSFIQEVLRVETHTVTALEDNDVIPYRGGDLPIVYLHRLFRMDEKPRSSFHVLVVDADSSAVGIAVDRIAKQREIVARPIEDPLVRVPGIAGATELGDGRPVLILDVAAIVDAMRGHRDLVPELIGST
jgi:two-component system, chemotaxis family, sensor kinase CheA